MSESIIIDAHVHMYSDREIGLLSKRTYQIWEYGPKENVRYSAYGGDQKDLLQAIRDAHARRVVAVNLFAVPRIREFALAKLPEDLDEHKKEEALKEIDASMADRLKASNAWYCDVAQKHHQIIPFIATDPSVLSVDEAQYHIRDMVEHYGAKGIKLHQGLQRFYMDDPRMLPIYRTCMELDIPIIVHSGPSRGPEQFAEPKAFVRVLKAFPELRLVLAHMGGGAWQQVPEIAKTYSNAYFDCCEIIEWTGAPDAPTDHQLAQLILDVGADRVLMGSDFPWYDIDHTVELVMELPLLSKEQKEAILGANAVRLLKL